jgi:5-methylcytosine-specific restriction protein A
MMASAISAAVDPMIRKSRAFMFTSNVLNGVPRAFFAHTYPSASARRNLSEKPARSRMPERLRYSCRHPTCPNKVRQSGFCAEHAGKGTSGWSARPTGRAGLYRGAWPAIRSGVLAEERNCRMCGAAATEVDHILPLAWGGNHDRSNLRAVCSPCHKAITAAMPRRKSRPWARD